MVESLDFDMTQVGSLGDVSNRRFVGQLSGVVGRWECQRKQLNEQQGREIKDWRGSDGGCPLRKQTHGQQMTEALGCLEKEDEGAGLVESLSCDPMYCSMACHPVHHQIPESTQTYVHCVGDAT